MPDNKNGSTDARRRFLKRTALAMIGGSVTAEFAVEGTVQARAQARRECLDAQAPMGQVEGKVAFITGGSSGIGMGVTRAFVDAGMKVILGYRTRKHLDEVMKYLEDAVDRVHAIEVDVTDRAGMEKASAEAAHVFGKIHVLVNNAGVVVFAPLSKTTYDDWDWVVSVNLTGVFNGIHTFLPRIQAHGEGGQIITTSSDAGLFAVSGLGGYSASKFGVVGMMETLRAELADTNIGVSVCCPGGVDTRITESSRNRPETLPDTGFKPDPKAVVVIQEYQESIRRGEGRGMNPLEAGQLVLRGMRNNDLYILTHPEDEQMMRDRNEVLIASIPRDLHAAEARMAAARANTKNSIYAAELSRKHCGGRGLSATKNE